MTTTKLIQELDAVSDIMSRDPDEAKDTLSDIIDRLRDEGVTDDKAAAR